jgi:methanogenesis imperfect marker protein 11
LELEDPYVVVYKQIHAVVDDQGRRVELMERSSCYGGSAWARYHYSRGPLVKSYRNIGEWFRYTIEPGAADLDLVSSKRSAGIESVAVKGKEVEVTYVGLGGGGVGATLSRAGAEDVLRYETTESGGGRIARGTIVLPRRERLIIGVDDTDSKTQGATWTLVHNIACKVDRREARYVSHSLVQLFPVPTKTQNCVSTVVEFACLPDRAEAMLSEFKALLRKYSVSAQTGMAVFRDYDPSSLLAFGERCKRERVSYEDALDAARENGVQIMMNGQGLIGAVAALPYCARPDESVAPHESLKA